MDLVKSEKIEEESLNKLAFEDGVKRKYIIV